MIKDCKILEEHIVKELRGFTDIAVIGLSGGADSTLVAILCMKALGAENVYGISMPSTQLDVNTFNARSKELAQFLGTKHINMPISEIVSNITVNILKNFGNINRINIGNAKARARMCLLYGAAHELANGLGDKRVRVIGTGNLSEDFIGYDTKGGDALADIFPIGELFKSEVYQMLDYYKTNIALPEELIDRVPSAGLWENQTDEGELGHTYAEMELAIKDFFTGSSTADPEVYKFTKGRHDENYHKHQAPPVIRIPSDWRI